MEEREREIEKEGGGGVEERERKGRGEEREPNVNWEVKVNKVILVTLDPHGYYFVVEHDTSQPILCIIMLYSEVLKKLAFPAIYTILVPSSQNGNETPDAVSMFSMVRALERLAGSHRAYCLSLMRENPVVKSLFVVPQKMTRAGLFPACAAPS